MCCSVVGPWCLRCAAILLKNSTNDNDKKEEVNGWLENEISKTARRHATERL